jgi:predicted NBD/HSP70 family sugar kinase
MNQHFMSVDLGGTYTKCAIIDCTGRILEKISVETPKDSLNSLLELIDNVFDKFSFIVDISGICISSPGAVNSEAGTIGGSSAIPYIHGPNIKEELFSRYQIPISIENDANCQALAEVWLGSASKIRNSIFISIGTGIGGAIIKDRKLHKGNNLHAGEFGYMLVHNYDNEYKIWSETSSTHALVEKTNCKDGIEVFEKYKTDKNIKIELDKWLYNLAVGIFNLQYVYDPELILLGGGISKNPEFIKLLKTKINQVCQSIQIAKVKPVIDTSKYYNDSNLIGAVYHHML